MNGQKFIKIIDGNKLVVERTQENFDITNEQMECIVSLLKDSFPQVDANKLNGPSAFKGTAKKGGLYESTPMPMKAEEKKVQVKMTE